MLWHQWEVSQDTCSLFLSSDLIRNIHFYANGKLNYHFSRVQTLKEKKKDKLVLSPELRMQIGLYKESLELTFQALAFDIHSDKGIMLKISAIETLCGGQFASSTLLIKPTFFFEGGSFNFIL